MLMAKKGMRIVHIYIYILSPGHRDMDSKMDFEVQEFFCVGFVLFCFVFEGKGRRQHL